MTSFRAGPPYFYVCLKCKHRFSLNRKVLVVCPKCMSTDVAKRPEVRK